MLKKGGGLGTARAGWKGARWGRAYAKLKPAPSAGSGPEAPHLVSLHLREDLQQPADVRGGSSHLPVELQDGNQLLFGDLLLQGDASVNCGRGAGAGKEPGAQSPPVCLGPLQPSSLLPRGGGWGPEVPSLSETTPPTPCRVALSSRPFPSLCCGWQDGRLGQQLLGDRGYGRESGQTANDPVA